LGQWDGIKDYKMGIIEVALDGGLSKYKKRIDVLDFGCKLFLLPPLVAASLTVGTE